MVFKKLWKNKMKVIITGGAGFIGGHAVQHFVECGDDVINIDKLTYAANVSRTKVCRFVQSDIRDVSSLDSVVKDFSPDFIINFAAETHVDNSIKNSKVFIESNLEGAAALMDVSVKNGIPLCHISTDEVYGPAGIHPFNESDQLCPMNPYSATKAAADLMLKSYRNTHGLNYLIVRPSNNYGPGQHQEKFIPKLIDSIRYKKLFPLYGTGNQEREWTYVTDTVSVIRKLIMSAEVKWNNDSIYNVSSGISLKNIEAVRIIINEYNNKNMTSYNTTDIINHVDDRPGHDKKYWISSDKLQRLLNYEFIKFKDGIKSCGL